MQKKSLLALLLAAALMNGCTDHFPQNPVQENPSAFKEIADVDLGNLAAAEISAYDPISKRLFTVNNEKAAIVDVLDLPALPAITKLQPIDVSALGGVANSVAVSDGKLAIALEATNKQAPGSIIVLNTSTLQTIRQITVGALPDMVTFSPDGRFIVSANEGEPNADYSVDPDGSVSIIDVTDNYSVRTLNFAGFAASYSALATEGFRVFGPKATFAQDIEPEYVAISENSQKAFVTLQENNGIAEIDLINGKIRNLHPLGTKDMSYILHAFDASDEDKKVELKNWPVKSFYLPDAISHFTVNGNSYVITADEGDAREYSTFDEQKRVSSLKLNPVYFPNGDELKKTTNLGRLRVTSTRGDKENDGVYEELYSFGGRGFSIFQTADMKRVYESGNSLEQEVIKAGIYDDARSDDKGIEPEGVTIGWMNGKPIAFIAMERVDAIGVYDVSNPGAPQFLQIIKTGDAPEGVLFIPADKSPNGKSLLVTSNEEDGTVKFYQP